MKRAPTPRDSGKRPQRENTGRRQGGPAGIDYSDIPETDAGFWAKAEVSVPAAKKMISIRVESDVLEWYRRHERYQGLMNAVLRKYKESAVAPQDSVARLLRQSEQFIQWMDEQVEGLSIPTDIRTRLAAGCLDMSLEHQKAIVALIARFLIGSAFALVRPAFEAYVRGVWLQRCASDREVQGFMDGDPGPSMAKTIAAIEQVEGFESAVLSRAKTAAWRAMNGYVHTGFEQVARRHTSSTIEPNYDPAEVSEVILFANAIGCLAAVAIGEAAQNAELSNAVLQKSKELWPMKSAA